MAAQIQKKELKKPNATTQLTMLLNRLLADTLNLKLQVKQAHWNIKGTNFIALHLLFDTIAAEADDHADTLAERVVQLGGVAAGTLEDIAKHSQLEAYPTNMQHIEQYVKAVAASLRICADDARAAIDIADELGDKVTADLFTGVARGLDKQRWLVESNLVGK